VLQDHCVRPPPNVLVRGFLHFILEVLLTHSSNADGDCPHDIPLRLALEPVFHQYGVDIVFEVRVPTMVHSLRSHTQAHEHSYERLFPVLNYTVLSFDYINPPVSSFPQCAASLTARADLGSPGDWRRWFHHPSFLLCTDNVQGATRLTAHVSIRS
jgi:hypothetical protein